MLNLTLFSSSQSLPPPPFLPTPLPSFSSFPPALPHMHRRRISPEGESSVSPPISPHSPSLYTFSMSKQAGLGIIISGGVNKPDGPQIFIDKVLDGMDAAKVNVILIPFPS